MPKLSPGLVMVPFGVRARPNVIRREDGSKAARALGLAIARWIVTHDRGSIAVESHPGQGSIFRVELLMIAAAVLTPLPV